MSEQYPDERFALLPVMRGRNRGMLHISHLVADRDFDPPLYVERDLFGPFSDREAARQYMLSRERVRGLPACLPTDENQ